MAVENVCVYPDSSLREMCTEITEDDDLESIVSSLVDTLEAHGAHGLAAPQIGINKRVFVTKIGDETKVFVNPVIVETEGKITFKEGCLSFPGVEEWIPRYEEITVEALDGNKEEFMLSLDELDGVAVQHEYDHLNGILFVDHVSSLKKRFMLKTLKKNKKKYGL